MKRTMMEIAEEVLLHGKPFIRAWGGQGTVQTGPTRHIQFGVRWGRLEVVLTLSGSVLMDSPKIKDEAYPLPKFAATLYNSASYQNTERSTWLYDDLMDKVAYLLEKRYGPAN